MKDMQLGPKNWVRTYEVYLDGALKYSGPTWEKAMDYCLREQRHMGGRI
jgi:hypothetical protein